MHKRLGLSALATLALTAAMTAQAEVAPGFYVGAGFGLYLNRRVRIEAWDIEIVLRRMQARLAQAARLRRRRGRADRRGRVDVEPDARGFLGDDPLPSGPDEVEAAFDKMHAGEVLRSVVVLDQEAQV